MPPISVPEGLPGIVGPLVAYPATAKHIRGLAQELLRGPSSLTPAEREIIGAHVSSGNECQFCAKSHASAARHLLGENAELMDEVLANASSPRLDEKLRALLTIAGKVRQDGRSVTAEDIARARSAGADDRAIHDTVLIAALFSMSNRYVDGLATFTPTDAAHYDEAGKALASVGYNSPAE
ncbi:MAG: carboxymuconolactone decarboxylase family protein [Pirellulales bacterium]